MNAGGLARAAALLAVPGTIAFGCDDRDDRRPGAGSAATASGNASQGGADSIVSRAGAASSAAGETGTAAGQTNAAAGETSTAAGETSAGGHGGAAGGAAGMAPEICDQDCLASVANQPSDFGISWESSWFLMGCKELRAHDCVTTLPAPCTHDASVPFEDRGSITLETFPIGGVPGQHYKVTFTFNAVASAKEYEGGTRDAGTAVPADHNAGLWDAFYRDGQPIPSNYDPWQLSVLDEAGVELRHYFMNAFPPGLGFESHRVFRLSYSKSIVVVGGGKVTHRVQDPNCLAIANCSESDGGGCGAGAVLPDEPLSLVLPAMYQDPQDGVVKPTTALTFSSIASQPWEGQLGHLTVTAVEETTDPVNHDYL